MKGKLVVLFVIFTIIVTACAAPAPSATPEKQPDQSQPTTAPTPAQQSNQASGQPVEISYMMWGSPEELAIWKQIVADFETANPNIKVKVDVSDWDGYWQKLKTLYAGNTPPDVFAMDGPLYPDWVSRGVLLNLQPYIEKEAGFLDAFYPVTLKAYQRPDGYYGLPRDFQTIVMFYNKDMFDQAGVAYPSADWTLEDLRTIAKKLTLDTNGDGTIDQWGIGTDLWDMELFWSEVLWGYGGEVLNADTTKTLLGEAKAREGWQFINDLVHTDKSMPTPDQASQYGYDLFQAGVVAMWPIGHWSLADYAAVDFKFDVAPFPAGPAGRATSVNSAGYVVAKDSKHPDEAWQFIKYAMSEAGQKRLAELGLAIPTLKSVAESPTFLEQKVKINHQVFLDSLEFARVKPSFKGYDEWATVVGDGLLPVWNGESQLNETLDQIVPSADEVLAKNQ